MKAHSHVLEVILIDISSQPHGADQSGLPLF